MSSQDIWGDMEIEMLRAGIEQLQADKERLMKEANLLRQAFQLLDGSIMRNHQDAKRELNKMLDILHDSKNTTFQRHKR